MPTTGELWVSPVDPLAVTLASSGLLECGGCWKLWRFRAVRDAPGPGPDGPRVPRLAQRVWNLGPDRLGLLQPTVEGFRDQLGTPHALMGLFGLRTGRGWRNSSVSPLWDIASH